jgi:hypothetical protein
MAAETFTYDLAGFERWAARRGHYSAQDALRSFHMQMLDSDTPRNADEATDRHHEAERQRHFHQLQALRKIQQALDNVQAQIRELARD